MTLHPKHVFALLVSMAVGLVVPAGLAAEPLAVVVETQKGKPIEGATITVKGQEGGEIITSTVTSNDGVAVIHELGGGEWYFEIDRPGYMLYTAYVRVRIGKKPELGFASQVSRGDDWEPMRVKIRKASGKLVRQANIPEQPQPRVREPVRFESPQEPPAEVATEPLERPAQRRVEGPTPEPEAPTGSVEAVAVPSTVATVEAESQPADQPAPRDLEVADGDPEPLTGEPPVTNDPQAEPEPSVDAVDPVLQPSSPPAADPMPDQPAGDPSGVEDQEPTQEEPSEPATIDTESVVPEPVVGPEVPATTEIDEGAESRTPQAGEEEPDSDPALIAEPPATTTTTPAVRSFDPVMSRSLRSAAKGDCPECSPDEWAISAGVQAATAGDTRSTSSCADDLPDLAADFARRLADRPQQPFAGPLVAALWNTADDSERDAMAEIGGQLVSPEGFCQVAGVVLPAEVTVTGYALEAWDELGGRACSAQGMCALPKAGWSGEPEVVSGGHATVVYSIFRNRSTRHQRNAQLTVLFTPPADWR